jgi:hypothetical protein
LTYGAEVTYLGTVSHGVKIPVPYGKDPSVTNHGVKLSATDLSAQFSTMVYDAKPTCKIPPPISPARAFFHKSVLVFLSSLPVNPQKSTYSTSKTLI